MNRAIKTGDSSLRLRVIIALIFAPLILWIFWVRGSALYIFLVAVTSLGQWEFFRMVRGKLRFIHRLVGFVSALLIVTDAFFLYATHLVGILIASMICYFLIEIFSGKSYAFENISLSLFSTIYPALFIIFLCKIDQIGSGIFRLNTHFILIFILLVIWMFDTASYFTGRFFGRHPFFTSISPHKTVEGFCGGIACAVLTGICVGLLVEKAYMVHVLVIAILAALAGQVGDLSESLLKREMNIKDSSNIIPGHGGVLDRFDSLFFAAPVVYCYLLVWSLIL